jgi:hypothetical protein
MMLGVPGRVEASLFGHDSLLDGVVNDALRCLSVTALLREKKYPKFHDGISVVMVSDLLPGTQSEADSKQFINRHTIENFLVLYCGFDINTRPIAALRCSKVISPREGYFRCRFGINPNG